jgi:predicted Zn-dependent protease
MAARGQPLNALQAGQFRQAMALLESGVHTQALSIARFLVGQSPDAADAWQLLGMCLAGKGHQPQAEAAFERALALVPGSPVVSRNYAMCLARRGKELRGKQAPEAAEPALRKAVSLAPDLASAWVDLGAVLRLLGRIDDALAAFGRAAALQRQRGVEPAELDDAINGLLADAGRPSEALAGARELVRRHPGLPSAHETLSHLLWEHGELVPGEDPLAAFRAAAAKQPDNHPLQLALARTLLTARCAQEAIALLEPLRRREPDNPLLDWFTADALDALQEHEDAGKLYASAVQSGLGEHPEFLNAYARHAFRTRRIDLAERCGNKVVTLDPRNQEGWSHLGTAWRLLEDEREHWLCDYERLVGYVEVPPPAGFADQACFLQARVCAAARRRAGNCSAAASR